MRIALIAPLVSTISEPFLGGAQAMLADLAQGLQARGHQITLFAREGSLVPGITIEPILVPESVQPSMFSTPGSGRSQDPGFFDQANLFLDLFLHLRERHADFDLVHAHAFDWPAFALGPLLGHLPILHTLHLPALSPEINQALQVLHQRQTRVRLATVSEYTAREYAPYTPIDRVIYNGINVQAIPFEPEVSEEAPLLYAGRITPEKGVESALEIARLSGKKIVLAGGIYDPSYNAQKVEPQLRRMGEQAEYVGLLEREKLWQLMGRCSGLLFPTAWDEPFGLTPVEAMATGTPVIAYRRGAIDEIILPGQTGFIIDPGNPAAAAILVPRLREISRATCREHVAQTFSLERMLDGYEQLYQQMLS